MRKGKRKLEHGERCLARPDPAGVRRACLACATACAICHWWMCSSGAAVRPPSKAKLFWL
jgi:hypothetical protein